MSCFFCNSLYHVSFNCDAYPTNKSRRKIVSPKNNCSHCLASKDEKGLFCSKCESNEKCYICFSKLHHSVYCNDRFSASNLFPPNIDINLLSRFIELLQFEEKYFMAFSYPYILDAIMLKPLKFSYHEAISFPSSEDYSNANVLVTDKICINVLDHRLNPIKVLQPTYLKSLIFHARHLEIKKDHFFRSKGKILSEEILLLLSDKLKSFRCGTVEFLPKLTFQEIIEKAPNLEYANFVDTNVEMSNSWPEVLLEYYNKNNFNQLHLTLPDLKFDVNTLSDLMKKMAARTHVLHLYIDLSCFQDGASSKMIKQEVDNFFAPVENIWQKGFRYFYVDKTRTW